MIGYVIILIIVVAFFYAIYSKMVEKEKTEEKTKAKHGEIKGYHSNGKLHYISNWNNGIQHGPIESYDEQGNLIKKSNLVNGEYQGEQIEYYPSGAIKTKRIYKNDEIVVEQEYDLLGNLKDKLDDENPAHITQMYLLRDKLNASKDEAEFNSIKQELINLIKDHSPKDSSGKHVSIAFIKECGDMLDGIILSDIEALKFHIRILKKPVFDESFNNSKGIKTNKFVKSSAIDFVNNKNGFSKLINSNTSFSNINKTNPVFWINADPKKFSKEFNIICIDKNDLIWFNIPQGEFNDPDKQFYIRKDNGKVHIEIPIKGENDYLNDIKNGVKLKKYARIYKIK